MNTEDKDGSIPVETKGGLVLGFTSDPSKAKAMEDVTRVATSGKTAGVHMEGAEGIIQIDAVTGHVLTGPLDRPDWAQGYTTAVLQERVGYYERALGDAFTPEMRDPEVFAAEDLDWVAVADDDEHSEYVAEHSAEHRQNVVMAFTKGDITTDEQGHLTGDDVIELSTERERSPEEAAALEESQKTGFRKVG
jgi:hypothetical protein